MAAQSLSILSCELRIFPILIRAGSLIHALLSRATATMKLVPRCIVMSKVNLFWVGPGQSFMHPVSRHFIDKYIT